MRWRGRMISEPDQVTLLGCRAHPAQTRIEARDGRRIELTYHEAYLDERETRWRSTYLACKICVTRSARSLTSRFRTHGSLMAAEPAPAQRGARDQRGPRTRRRRAGELVPNTAISARLPRLARIRRGRVRGDACQPRRIPPGRTRARLQACAAPVGRNSSSPRLRPSAARGARRAGGDGGRARRDELKDRARPGTGSSWARSPTADIAGNDAGSPQRRVRSPAKPQQPQPAARRGGRAQAPSRKRLEGVAEAISAVYRHHQRRRWPQVRRFRR